MFENGYSLLLPEGFLQYFEVVNVRESKQEIILYLEEKNTFQEEHPEIKVESKGFYPSVLVHDFPLRGRPLLLDIRRRRWINKETGEYLTRDLHINAQGTRLTTEFAAFLKGLHR